jgi:hypothetical protein
MISEKNQPVNYKKLRNFKIFINLSMIDYTKARKEMHFSRRLLVAHTRKY